MPRIPRGLRGGGVAHVLSRGNGRATVFHSASEYQSFIALLDEARQRHPVDLLAFCLMPNHFHLVARVEQSAELSAMMQWWLTSHVRRHHQRHASSGHIWQGRFKSFPIQEDAHLLTVLRYVLLNPCRTQLVRSPWDWQWSSLRFERMLAPWPVEPAQGVDTWLATPLDECPEEDVRASIRRGTPFGDSHWRARAADAWGLEATLRPRGRPKAAGASSQSLGA
ncbi:MAG: transposase [Archangium sp.]|nr:transposase [Archangium sp.]